MKPREYARDSTRPPTRPLPETREVLPKPINAPFHTLIRLPSSLVSNFSPTHGFVLPANGSRERLESVRIGISSTRLQTVTYLISYLIFISIEMLSRCLRYRRENERERIARIDSLVVDQESSKLPYLIRRLSPIRVISKCY